MSEFVRILGLLTGLPVALSVFAIGIAAVTEVPDPSWIMFIIGGVLVLLTGPPLLLGTPQRGARSAEPGGTRQARPPAPRRAR